jgi:dolichyl-phosphate beta-glucosyltransferase
MGRKTLTVVVPAFNEERRLGRLLVELTERGDLVCMRAGFELVEILVVDDGSTDRTSEILARAQTDHPRLRVLRRQSNGGKGAAVRDGVGAARGDCVLMTDVDLSTPLDELESLANALNSGARIAIGSRSVTGARVILHQPRHRELMGKCFNVLLRVATGVPWRDTQCGFKLFDRSAALPLFELQRIDGFAFDAELCVNARRLGIRLDEVPIRWTDNPDTRVTLVGSSLRMLVDLVRIAWRTRRPLRPTVRGLARLGEDVDVGPHS